METPVAVAHDTFVSERLISRAEMSGPQVVDLFAGAGGFSLGFRAAGYKVTKSLEIDAWACDTLSANHADGDVFRADIREVDDETLGSFLGKPDVLIGGPPCQGFSHSNNSADPSDPRNTLFKDFIRAVAVSQPRALLLENVPGLLRRKTRTGESVIRVIASEYEKVGYKAHVGILRAVDFGVPQLRPRVFVMGLRHESDTPFPAQTHAVGAVTSDPQLFSIEESNTQRRHLTLWEAISDLPEVEAREGAMEIEYDRPANNAYEELLRADSDRIYNHKAMNHSARIVERFAALDWGQSGADAPDHLRPRRRNGNGEVSAKDYDQNNRRLYPHRPCHTIPASFYANFVHPYANRNFTPREGARIQSFPDWYRFLGKATVVSQKLLTREGRTSEKHLSQYNQIGNAVPPLLAYHLANHLRELI